MSSGASHQLLGEHAPNEMECADHGACGGRSGRTKQSLYIGGGTSLWTMLIAPSALESHLLRAKHCEASPSHHYGHHGIRPVSLGETDIVSSPASGDESTTRLTLQASTDDRASDKYDGFAEMQARMRNALMHALFGNTSNEVKEIAKAVVKAEKKKRGPRPKLSKEDKKSRRAARVRQLKHQFEFIKQQQAAGNYPKGVIIRGKGDYELGPMLGALGGKAGSWLGNKAGGWLSGMMSKIFGTGDYTVTHGPQPAVNSIATFGATTTTPQPGMIDVIETDCLGKFPAQDLFVGKRFNLDITDAATFPWAHRFAPNYQKWRLVGCVVTAVTNCSDTIASDVQAQATHGFYASADIDAPEETTDQGSRNRSLAVMDKIAKSVMAGIECDPKQTVFYTKMIPVPGQKIEDQSKYKAGYFVYFGSGAQAVFPDATTLYISYHLQFLEQRLTAPGGPVTLIDLAGDDATRPMKPIPDTTLVAQPRLNGIGVTVSADQTELIFPTTLDLDPVYFVNWLYGGTTNTANLKYLTWTLGGGLDTSVWQFDQDPDASHVVTAPNTGTNTGGRNSVAMFAFFYDGTGSDLNPPRITFTINGTNFATGNLGGTIMISALTAGISTGIRSTSRLSYTREEFYHYLVDRAAKRQSRNGPPPGLGTLTQWVETFEHHATWPMKRRLPRSREDMDITVTEGIARLSRYILPPGVGDDVITDMRRELLELRALVGGVDVKPAAPQPAEQKLPSTPYNSECSDEEWIDEMRVREASAARAHRKKHAENGNIDCGDVTTCPTCSSWWVQRAKRSGLSREVVIRAVMNYCHITGNVPIGISPLEEIHNIMYDGWLVVYDDVLHWLTTTPLQELPDFDEMPIGMLNPRPREPQFLEADPGNLRTAQFRHLVIGQRPTPQATPRFRSERRRRNRRMHALNGNTEVEMCGTARCGRPTHFHRKKRKGGPAANLGAAQRVAKAKVKELRLCVDNAGFAVPLHMGECAMGVSSTHYHCPDKYDEFGVPVADGELKDDAGYDSEREEKSKELRDWDARRDVDEDKHNERQVRGDIAPQLPPQGEPCRFCPHCALLADDCRCIADDYEDEQALARAVRDALNRMRARNAPVHQPARVVVLQPIFPPELPNNPPPEDPPQDPPDPPGVPPGDETPDAPPQPPDPEYAIDGSGRRIEHAPPSGDLENACNLLANLQNKADMMMLYKDPSDPNDKGVVIRALTTIVRKEDAYKHMGFLAQEVVSAYNRACDTAVKVRNESARTRLQQMFKRNIFYRLYSYCTEPWPFDAWHVSDVAAMKYWEKQEPYSRVEFESKERRWLALASSIFCLLFSALCMWLRGRISLKQYSGIATVSSELHSWRTRLYLLVGAPIIEEVNKRCWVWSLCKLLGFSQRTFNILKFISGASFGYIEGTAGGMPDRWQFLLWRCLIHGLWATQKLLVGVGMHSTYNLAVLAAHYKYGSLKVASFVSGKDLPNQQLPGAAASSKTAAVFSSFLALVAQRLLGPMELKTKVVEDVCLDDYKIKAAPVQDGFKVKYGEAECKPGHGATGCWGIAGFTGTSFRSCIHNEVISLSGRVGKKLPAHSDPETTLAIYRRWVDMTGWFLDILRELRVPFAFKPVPYEQWCASFEPARRDMLLQIARDGHDMPQLRAKSFIKKEIAVKVTEDPTFKDPRWIQGCPPELSARTGPYLRRWVKRLKAAWLPIADGSTFTKGRQIVYTCGMNASAIGQHFADAIEVIESSMDMDDQLVFIEDDQSRFDLHLLRGPFHLLDKVYAQHMPKTVRKYLRRGVSRGTSNLGTKYSVPYTMQSGWPDTATGDSIINAAMKMRLHVWKRLWIAIICGDDSVVITTRKELERMGGISGIQAFYASLGMEIEAAVRYHPLDVEFCSGRFYPANGTYVLMPKTGRILSKIGWDMKVRSPDNRLAWLRGISNTMIELGKIDPLLNSLGVMLKERLGGGRVVVDREWQKYYTDVGGSRTTVIDQLVYYDHHYQLSTKDLRELVALISASNPGDFLGDARLTSMAEHDM